jgi:anti-anti-sigma regulatory factor
MSRRLLIIWKDPEFDNRGEVVLGQCEPFTSGWTLTLIQPSRERENLMVGTYTDLRKIQESCAEIDTVEKIRKRVQDMRALMLMSVTETVAIHLDRRTGRDSREETREMPTIQPKTSGPINTPGGLLELTAANGVVIARISQPERASDSEFIRQEFSTLVEMRPAAVLIDLHSVESFTLAAFKELSIIRDRLRDTGAEFALCNVSPGARQKMQGLKAKDALAVYDTQDSAMEALKS